MTEHRTTRNPAAGQERKDADRSLSTHILPVSATMVGVCMTVLSIGHLGPGGEFRSVVDKLLAVDALVFLASALLSFLAMRSSKRAATYESRADIVFIVGLVLLALRTVVLAFVVPDQVGPSP